MQSFNQSLRVGGDGNRVNLSATGVRTLGRSARHRAVVWLQRAAREPLVHFLLAGFVLFGLATRYDRSPNAGSEHRIDVSAVEIQHLRDVWSRQWGRAPNPVELNHLIEDFVRDEVLYREAIAAGIDKDDTIIRRRLVEKMGFLSQELAANQPSEKDLAEYFQQNQAKFKIPAQISFSHIYFSTSTRGTKAEGDARRLLVKLESRERSSDKTSGLGDPFMLQSEYPLQTEEQVTELFGRQFASELFHLGSGAWQGPIRSGYGFHLVHIEQSVPARIPELAEIQDQVLTDFKSQRLQSASETFYSGLRKRYEVEIDKKALESAETSEAATSRKNPTLDGSGADAD